MVLRACLGRFYAKEFLKEFFTPILNSRNDQTFQPEINHLYSGRDNDCVNFKESIYQIKYFIKICSKLIKQNYF